MEVSVNSAYISRLRYEIEELDHKIKFLEFKVTSVFKLIKNPDIELNKQQQIALESESEQMNNELLKLHQERFINDSLIRMLINGIDNEYDSSTERSS